MVVFSSLLFNLFLNGLAPFLLDIDFHCPKFGPRHVPLLLYADDTVPTCCSRIGWKCLLSRWITLFFFFTNHKLLLNYKSKIIIFSKSWKSNKWIIEGKEIKQVKYYKYRVIYFQYNASWSNHHKCIMKSFNTNIAAIECVWGGLQQR